MRDTVEPIRLLIDNLPTKARARLMLGLIGQDQEDTTRAPASERYLSPREAAAYVGLSTKHCVAMNWRA